MSQIGTEKPKEYSDEFDKLRQNRVELSYYKYGSASINFGCGLVNALETHELCIKKYLETGNREYLLDAANYLMFEFMYPQARKDTYFKATDSKDSAGIVGTCHKDLGKDKNFGLVTGDV